MRLHVNTDVGKEKKDLPGYIKESTHDRAWHVVVADEKHSFCH